MAGLGKIGLWLGVASLVIAVISRWMVAPIGPGIESEAIAKFAATCFLLSIAASLACCKAK